MKFQQLEWKANGAGNERETKTRFGHFKITADGDGWFTLWVDGREINMDESIEAMKNSAQVINDGRRKEWSKKRFLAAKAAMQGLLASIGADAPDQGGNFARVSIDLADELLRQLEETE